MAEYVQSWKKRLRLKHLVDLAHQELGEKYDDKDIERIQEKLDSEMKKKWKLIKSTRKEYHEIVRKILRKEYVLNV